MPHPFELFCQTFIPRIEKKTTLVNKASWLLETTGSSDAADLRAELDGELKTLFSDAKTYCQLVQWEKEGGLPTPLLQRELNVLLRAFKQMQVAPSLLEALASKEAALAQSYATFRAQMDNKLFTVNGLKEILKKEVSVEKRKSAWEASKQGGAVFAPQILELVRIRNQMAHGLGYADFFQMQLELQEIDPEWLFSTLEALFQDSEAAYSALIREIEQAQSDRFGVAVEMLGPWAWSEPFAQEDPLNAEELDELVKGVDIIEASRHFYSLMGIDVSSILARSDMLERPGKSQHAFCVHIDRKGEIRTLNNVKSTLKWLETVLHELGHAIYEQGLDPKLPWLLREPSHTMTTEAMALLAGRQAYCSSSLELLVGKTAIQADQSLRRRQLIFCRFVLVMTTFERGLYQNPAQDLNALWWSCVEKYQKIHPPKGREGKADWATKDHIGIAPVYYFSYLLGELFASSIEKAIRKETGLSSLATVPAGRFLQEKLFFPGNKISWNSLVKHVTGEPLSAQAWLEEFAFTSLRPIDKPKG